MTELSNDMYAVSRAHYGQYHFGADVTDFMSGEAVPWNEFRSLGLYGPNYQFGLNEKPLLYIYGTHFSANRFMILPAPDDDKAVSVFIRLPKAKAEKFRRGEAAFLEKYQVRDPV